MNTSLKTSLTKLPLINYLNLERGPIISQCLFVQELQINLLVSVLIRLGFFVAAVLWDVMRCYPKIFMVCLQKFSTDVFNLNLSL